MKTKIKKIFITSSLVFIGISSLFALTYEELLQNYCNQDIQFEELTIAYQQAELSYEQTQINNGFSISASTGAIKLDFDENQITTSFSPSLNIGIPSLSNTEATISLPVSVSKDAVSLQNAGISVSTEIISSSKEKRDLTLEKSLRSLEEAKRKLEARVVALEKSFLTELKNLYSLGLSVYEAEENLLSKKISLESIKLQGYSETSSKYRSSNLSVKSAEYDLEKATRKYATTLEKFVNACDAKDLDIYSLEIPEVDLLKIGDFEKENFTAIESTLWSNYTNERNREAEKDFTLSANASANFSQGNEKASSTIGAGLTGAYKGLQGKVNLNLPTDGKTNPSVSFSLSWNPNQGKLAKIDEELTSLKERQEVISLKKAYDDYESTFNEYETERENLLWQYEKIMEEVSMYKELAEDTAFWYKEGIVSESEYRQANMNYAKALLSLTNSKIEQLIYNLNLKSQFVN